jgi:hypothetical protein
VHSTSQLLWIAEHIHPQNSYCMPNIVICAENREKWQVSILKNFSFETSLFCYGHFLCIEYQFLSFTLANFNPVFKPIFNEASTKSFLFTLERINYSVSILPRHFCAFMYFVLISNSYIFLKSLFLYIFNTMMLAKATNPFHLYS